MWGNATGHWSKHTKSSSRRGGSRGGLKLMKSLKTIGHWMTVLLFEWLVILNFTKTQSVWTHIHTNLHLSYVVYTVVELIRLLIIRLLKPRNVKSWNTRCTYTTMYQTTQIFGQMLLCVCFFWTRSGAGCWVQNFYNNRAKQSDLIRHVVQWTEKLNINVSKTVMQWRKRHCRVDNGETQSEALETSLLSRAA